MYLRDAEEMAHRAGATHRFGLIVDRGDYMVRTTEYFVVNRDGEWFMLGSYDYDRHRYTPLGGKAEQIEKCGTKINGIMYTELREIYVRKYEW